MAKLEYIEHGIFNKYFTYEVMRDDYSSRREFEDYEEARDYYNQLQALDNQEESLRLQKEEMKRNQEERDRQRRIAEEDRERQKWIRPPRPSQQPVPQQPAIRKCAKCGASLLDDSLFCHNCGARREKCSCGAFLDAGMKFCSKCGKPTPAEAKRQAEERRRQEEERIAEQKRQAEEVAEEKWRMEVKANCIDRGDYIELIRPVLGIRMIEKECSSNFMTWDQAMQYAKNLRKGGFSDWRVPTKEELLEISKIKDICGINGYYPSFWSSSTLSDDTSVAWIVYFDSFVSDDYKTNINHVRCVR